MRIAVVGSYGVGLTMRLPRLPAAGETLTGGEFATGHGGKGSNQAVAAARLGAEVSLHSAVGPDAFGQDARALWRAEGVDDRHVVTGHSPTMVGVILVEPSGENRIVIAPGALDELTAEGVAAFRPAIADADLLVVGLEIPLAVALAALQIARTEGTPTLLNPAPAQPLPVAAWPLIDTLTPNQTEAVILTGGDPAQAERSPGQIVDHLRGVGRFTGDIVLTRGGAGAVIDSPRTGRHEVGAIPVARVVDTTGAGDAFTAALAVGIAAGHPLLEAAAFAAAAGAFAVTRAEVLPGLPTRAEVERVIAAGAA